MRSIRAGTTWSALVVLIAGLGLLAGCGSSTGGKAQRAGSAVLTTEAEAGASPTIRPMPPLGTPASSGADSSATTGNASDVAQWTFTVVRHADRADDGTDDPPLTVAGQERAGRLAERLTPQHGSGVYASPYQRAQATATPTATAWGVPVTTYDPATDAATLIAQAKRDHPSGAILIVGHSDTVPEIVGALCQCTVDPITEDDFGNLFQVSLDANGGVVNYRSLDDY